jgi:hypothetical protein
VILIWFLCERTGLDDYFIEHILPEADGIFSSNIIRV